MIGLIIGIEITALVILLIDMNITIAKTDAFLKANKY